MFISIPFRTKEYKILNQFTKILALKHAIVHLVTQHNYTNTSNKSMSTCYNKSAKNCLFICLFFLCALQKLLLYNIILNDDDSNSTSITHSMYVCWLHNNHQLRAFSVIIISVFFSFQFFFLNNIFLCVYSCIYRKFTFFNKLV